jgi:hypothetical protein
MNKKRSYCFLILGLIMFTNIIYSCRYEQSKDVKSIISKYLFQTNTFIDSVIYYKFKSDTLILHFPSPPQNRRWKFGGDNYDMFISKVDKENNVYIKDPKVLEVSNKPTFFIVSVPFDTLMFYHEQTKNLINFSFRSDGNGKLTRVFNFSADVININFVKDVKDEKIVNLIQDSIQRRLGYK